MSQLGHTIRDQYPDRVPILVREAPGTPAIHRNKFLAPGEMTVARFVAHIRQHIPVTRDEALFVFVGDPHRPSSMVLPVLSQTLEEIYGAYRHEDDGLLYLRYSKENTFGGEYTLNSFRALAPALITLCLRRGGMTMTSPARKR